MYSRQSRVAGPCIPTRHVPLTVTISHAVDVAHDLSLAVVVSLSIRTVMEWHVVTLRVEQRCRTARPDTNRTTA